MTAAGLGLNKFCYAGLITAIKNKLPTTEETTTKVRLTLQHLNSFYFGSSVHRSNYSLEKIIEYVKQSKGWTSPEASSDGGENMMRNVAEEELYNIPTADFVHRRAFVNRSLTIYHAAIHACAELRVKR